MDFQQITALKILKKLFNVLHWKFNKRLILNYANVNKKVKNLN